MKNGIGNTSDMNVLLRKFDGDGNLVWNGDFGTQNTDWGYDLAIDSAGDLFLGGVTYGALGDAHAGHSDAFLVKLTNTSGATSHTANPEPATLALTLLAVSLPSIARRSRHR